jgi:hypothetical protein
MRTLLDSTLARMRKDRMSVSIHGLLESVLSVEKQEYNCMDKERKKHKKEKNGKLKARRPSPPTSPYTFRLSLEK